MAFTKDTKILTNTGWKHISDLRGRDRVLVRNFLGEAEFIQPFALKKSYYDGEVVQFGGKYWSVTVTPEHKIVYDTNPTGVRATQYTTTAKDIMVDKRKLLYRKFRYLREDRTTESITLYKGMERRVTLSDEDWYTIVAYTVMKGFISKDKNPRLKFMLQMHQIYPLTSIFDKLGIGWAVGNVNGSFVVTVHRDNNLARKLKLFLGARARRDMSLPDKMIYGSSQGLMKHFIDTITTLVAKPSVKRPKQLLFASTNRKLLENLKMICMFCGYSFSMTETEGGFVAYVIPGKVSPWSVRFVEKSTYSGYIYEIDLFDGLVYVTEKSLPVWISPK